MDALPPAPTHRPQKLAIVHLLGWTLGVAAVLGIYRAAAAWQAEDGTLPQLHWQALGYGLAYGTAISGLGLFFWRWHLSPALGPSQPGHWILVFTGIGLVIDVGLAAIIEGALAISGTGTQSNEQVPWMTHQVVGWSVSSLIGFVVLFNMRGTTFLWTVASIAIVLMLTANAAIHAIALVALLRGAAGTWVWHVPFMIRVGGAACALLILWYAVLGDIRSRVPRDWLHAGGVAAVTGLGLVDIITNLPRLMP